MLQLRGYGYETMLQQLQGRRNWQQTVLSKYAFLTSKVVITLVSVWSRDQVFFFFFFLNTTRLGQIYGFAGDSQPVFRKLFFTSKNNSKLMTAGNMTARCLGPRPQKSRLNIEILRPGWKTLRHEEHFQPCLLLYIYSLNSSPPGADSKGLYNVPKKPTDSANCVSCYPLSGLP